MVYTSYTNNSGSIAQGVQQNYDIIALLRAEITDIRLELVAYPNPIQEILTLKINNYNNELLTYQLYDLQNKLYDSQPIKGAHTQHGINYLAVGTYLLSIQNEKALIKTFESLKIISSIESGKLFIFFKNFSRLGSCFSLTGL